MTPGIPAAPEPLSSSVPTALPRPRVPFWGWSDAGLFIGLGIPILLLTEVLFRWGAEALHLRTDDPLILIGAQSLAYVAIFAMLAMILRVGYDAPFWQSLGWVPSRVGLSTAVTAGVVLAFGLSILGGLLRIETKGSEIAKLLGSPHGLIAIPLFAILIAPLSEELVFRGFLQPLFIRSLGVVAGIVVTSSLFGMLHWQEYGNSWGAAGIIGLTGLTLGILRHISGSTRISAVAHLAYNSTLFIFFIAGGRNTST